MHVWACHAYVDERPQFHDDVDSEDDDDDAEPADLLAGLAGIAPMSTKLRGAPTSAKMGARLALRAASSSKTSAKADHEGKDAFCNKRLVKCVRAMVSNADEWLWTDGSNKLLDDFLREHCAEHWKFKNKDTLDVAIDGFRV